MNLLKFQFWVLSSSLLPFWGYKLQIFAGHCTLQIAIADCARQQTANSHGSAYSPLPIPHPSFVHILLFLSFRILKNVQTFDTLSLFIDVTFFCSHDSGSSSLSCVSFSWSNHPHIACWDSLPFPEIKDYICIHIFISVFLHILSKLIFQ